MYSKIVPRLPMTDKLATKDFYIQQLGFSELGDYGDYLLLKKDEIEINFFEFKELNTAENYGMVYIRVQEIDKLYASFLQAKVAIHPKGKLEIKPWH